MDDRNVFYLEDEDGNIQYLNDDTVTAITRGSLTPNEEKYTFDSKVVERTGQPGSVRLGKIRPEEREFSITFTRAETTQEEFEDAENTLLNFLEKVEYLVDETTGYRISVVPTEYTVTYEDGSYKLLSTNTLTLTALNPFWESLEEMSVVIDVTGGDIRTKVFDIDSYTDLPVNLSVLASEECDSIELYLQETLQGIFIDDPLLGQEGYETLDIDNEEGTVKLGTLDRTQYIEAGTGFFKFSPGTNTLVILTSGDCTITATYRERRYL